MKKSGINSSVLIALSQGDDKAFELVFNTYASSIFKYLVYVLKNVEESEEILQNVFFTLWNKRENLLVDKDVRAYLFKIANSLAIDALRRSIRSQHLINEILLNPIQLELSAEEIYLSKEKFEILDEAISHLPPKRKEIFILCKIEGRSYTEVGKILNISPSTISNQLVSAMRFLKSYITK